MEKKTLYPSPNQHRWYYPIYEIPTTWIVQGNLAHLDRVQGAFRNGIVDFYISVSVTEHMWCAAWHTSVYLDTREAENVEVKGVFYKG